MKYSYLFIKMAFMITIIFSILILKPKIQEKFKIVGLNSHATNTLN